ncbi:hypothetical protein J6590_104600, partial [Homalodisca vitripennis]
MPSRCNQDCLESYFSLIRGLGKFYDHPLPTAVSNRIKSLLLSRCPVPLTKHGNCLEEDSATLSADLIDNLQGENTDVSSAENISQNQIEVRQSAVRLRNVCCVVVPSGGPGRGHQTTRHSRRGKGKMRLNPTLYSSFLDADPPPEGCCGPYARPDRNPGRTSFRAVDGAPPLQILKIPTTNFMFPKNPAIRQKCTNAVKRRIGSRQRVVCYVHRISGKLTSTELLCRVCELEKELCHVFFHHFP